jgi:hypothetical protein
MAAQNRKVPVTSALQGQQTLARGPGRTPGLRPPPTPTATTTVAPPCHRGVRRSSAARGCHCRRRGRADRRILPGALPVPLAKLCYPFGVGRRLRVPELCRHPPSLSELRGTSPGGVEYGTPVPGSEIVAHTDNHKSKSIIGGRQFLPVMGNATRSWAAADLPPALFLLRSASYGGRVQAVLSFLPGVSATVLVHSLPR